VVGAVGAGNTIQNYAGNAASASYGVYLIYQTSPNVSYNTINNAGGGGVNATSTLYGIFMSSSNAGGDAVFNNNNITLGQGSTSGAQPIYISPVCASATVNYNTISYGTFASTSTSYMIYCSNGTLNINVIGNQNTAISKTGAGSFYGFYDFGSPAGGIASIQNNNFSNITLTGASTFYGIYYASSTSQTKTITGNTISNITGGTSSVYGIYTNYDGPGTQIYLNTVTGLTGTGSAVYGYSIGAASSTGTIAFYRNDSYNISCSGTGAVYGVYLNGSTGLVNNCYRNNIYNITGNNASSIAYGLYIAAGTTINAYNNFISEIKAPLANAAQAVNGIYVAGGTTIGLYYNTIFLDATSSGALFGSNGIYASTTPTVDMRNNIVVNVSTPNGATGYTAAYRRSTTTLTSYAATSNNNDFYAGIPGANNVIFTDGTNYDQTIGAFKGRVSPSDGASFTENPPFVNIGSSPYNLHINTAIATQTESGGTPVTTPIAITDDFDGNTRNVTTPDVGADEFSGIGIDLTPPSIVYTPLNPTSSLSSRTLTASISDASGVPTAGSGLPVLYWRINSGSWSPATATYISGSNYQFTLGSGVALGDTVKYYVVAQDDVVPPNVGAFPSAGAGGFTANPPAAATPPTNPSSYLIVGLPLSGSYTVGTTLFSSITGRDITFEKSVSKVLKEVVVESGVPEVIRQKGIEYADATELSSTANGIKKMVEIEEISWIPMENGKVYEGDLFVKKAENPSLDFPEGIDGVYLTITAAINDLNLRGVSGATTFLLTDATYPTETFPLTIDVVNDNIPTAVNNVTIKPNTGVTATVSGASAASQIFKILSSYITIDGSNSGGTTRDFTIENTSATTPQVIVIGSKGITPITNVTVKNCIIRNGVTSSSALIVSDGNAPGTAGWFNNITIQNNSIQKAYIGNYNIAVVSPGNGSGLLVQGNDLNSLAPNHIALIGLYAQGIDGATLTNNRIGNYTTTYTANVTGIWFATGTVNSNITNNTIGPINITTAAPRGIVVTSAVSNANVSVASNTVDSMLTSYSGPSYGIWVFSTTTGVVIEKNIVSNIQNTNTGGYGARGIHVSTGIALTNVTIRNNVVKHVRATADVSSTYWGIGIGIEGATTGVNVYYNTVNLYDTLVGYTSATIHAAFAVLTSTAALLDVRDNVFVNTFNNVNSTTDRSYAIYSTAPNTAYTFINYNDYYASGVAGALGYLGAEITTLTAWQTATGQDANSIASNPQFVSNTDLRPLDTSPLLIAGTPIAGITTDILGATRNVTTPTIGAYEMPVYIPLSGTYTVGLSAFMQATGKKITFETRTRTVVKDLLGADADIDILAYEEKNGTPPVIDESQRYVTVTEEYVEMMEDGKPFDYSFFMSDASMGVYPTITAARNDLILRGVSGPVTFLLVDTNYPSETYPIELTAFGGASATNTVTFKPATGVQAVIPGSTTQTTATLRLNTDGQYYIIDGSNTVGGTTRDLSIIAPAVVPAVHFFSNGSNNVVKNCIIQSQQTSTASGSLILAAGTASNNNLIDNCWFRPVPSAAVYAIGVYLFSSTLSSNNTLSNNEFVDFSARGITMQGAAGVNGNKAIGNLIHQTTPSTATTIYGVYLGRGKNNVVEGNIINNLQSTSSTATQYGIYYIGASGDTMNIKIFNNVISLSAGVNQTAGTIRGIDYFGYAANSVEIYYNTVYIGGSNVTAGTTAALIKRDVAINFVVKDNTFNNARSNISGTGIHYAVQFTNTTTTLLDLNYNHYYASGTGGVFGIFGTTSAPDLATWQTLTSQEANSISNDPIFVSNLDYRPQSVSPLLAAGLTISGITTDILGALRGTPPTIGAFENGVFVAINSPSNLAAIPDTFTVDLGWQDNSNNEFGFIIQRKLGDSLSVDPWINIDTVNANVINYLDTGLNPNTMYSYRVFGYNSSGNSGFSNIVTTTTFIPVELTAFTAELSGREILVSWATATELNNRGFDIERNMNGEWEKIGFKEGRGTSSEASHYSFVDKFTYESFVGTIIYRLKQMDFDGTYAYSPEVEVNVDFTPKEYTLYQNYPNPFNPVTTIKYSLPFESNVRIAVYNILGEMIDVLVDETKAVGFHDFNWNASNLASGIYIYTIEAKSLAGDKNYSSVKKMILMK
jgi:hypothetical protein